MTSLQKVVFGEDDLLRFLGRSVRDCATALTANSTAPIRTKCSSGSRSERLSENAEPRPGLPAVVDGGSLVKAIAD